MMHIARSSLALLLVVTATSNGILEATNLRQRNLSGTTIATNVNTYTAYTDYASAMLTAVNKQRATSGLSPLCLNTKLHIAAQRQSNDMAANDFMDHVGSDGSTMAQRITQAGYDWETVAENVAAGHVDVDDVMVGWINSPGHLENIMGNYTMFGSAYAFNGEGTYQHYWTQEFGSSEVEQCDDSVLTTPYDTTAQNVDEVQSGAETVVTPALTTATDALAVTSVLTAIDAPATETLIVEAPVTPAADGLKGKDCESNF